jgi:hypothetical protein
LGGVYVKALMEKDNWQTIVLRRRVMLDLIECDLCGEFYEYESEGKDE